MRNGTSHNIPVVDLSWANDPLKKDDLLDQLRVAAFEVGFLYLQNHGVKPSIVSNLTNRLPALFDLPESEKASLSKLNSPHFLGYSAFAEETTLGNQDLREQFDFATELPVVYQDATPAPTGLANGDSEPTKSHRDFTKLYWRLRGPNQWPSEPSLPGFRTALIAYHDAVQSLSYRFVHLIEEAFGIPVGTFDRFFGNDQTTASKTTTPSDHRSFLPPQHRLKLLKYPPANLSNSSTQGVGPHKDSSGWLTFLLQVGTQTGLEVLGTDDSWIPAPPQEGTFVVNFGNAMEAATEGAVKATVHRVVVEDAGSMDPRYSIPFFQGLPLDLGVEEVRGYIPASVRSLRRTEKGKDGAIREGISSFLDPRWDSLGESQLRKWVRSHRDVALKWYGPEMVEYYSAA